jgi:diguanylate cyclase (GGDEF)-like protein
VTVPALLSGELRATGWTLALVAALNLLVCVVWIRGVLRSKVTGRLERFAALSERMDGGARWPVEGRDEIDTLASALNHLVDDLGRQQAALDRLANSDLVTGLPNRRRLLEVLDERLGAGGAASSVLVYIDLVGFKSLNDVHGHAAGDAVLAVFGERLRQLPAPLFCAARVGGDEFGLVLDGVGLHDGAAWFGTVIDGLVKPVDWAGHRVRFNLIAGVAARPDQGDVTTWMSMADLAMYAARRERQGRVGLFTEALRASSATRRVIGERLYGAIESGEIQAWFQPVVRASDGEVVGFEALARWRLDDTWISPDQFVPAAEDAGLIGRLTERILEQTCDFLTALAATGRADVRCSVNVSPGQVADPQLAEQLLAVLDARGVDPRRLAVEITEEAVQSRHERVAETLSVLRARGVQVWLDDFGIGHASFARLRDFSFDVLKIDRSFTRVRGDGMLEGIVQFGQRMGLSVTAEGVETAEDLEALRAMGCDRVQGYHIGRPMPAEQAVAWRSPAKCA